MCLRSPHMQTEDYSFSPDPTTMLTDFKQAVLCAIPNAFGQHMISRGCYYHLTQATWRKVQEVGLTRAYKQPDLQIKHWCGIIDSLAFLPIEDVPAGMDWIKQHVPVELTYLVAYFDTTYVSGSFRRTQALPAADGAVQPFTMCCLPALIPQALWNINEAMLNNEARTNNLYESWNYGFQQLVDQCMEIYHSNPEG